MMRDEKMASYWYNFKTKEYEIRETPTTDEEAINYIPDVPAARGIYQCNRALGKTILESMLDALTACIPK